MSTTHIPDATHTPDLLRPDATTASERYALRIAGGDPLRAAALQAAAKSLCTEDGLDPAEVITWFQPDGAPVLYWAEYVGRVDRVANHFTTQITAPFRALADSWASDPVGGDIGRADAVDAVRARLPHVTNRN